MLAPTAEGLLAEALADFSDELDSLADQRERFDIHASKSAPETDAPTKAPVISRIARGIMSGE